VQSPSWRIRRKQCKADPSNDWFVIMILSCFKNLFMILPNLAFKCFFIPFKFFHTLHLSNKKFHVLDCRASMKQGPIQSHKDLLGRRGMLLFGSRESHHWRCLQYYAGKTTPSAWYNFVYSCPLSEQESSILFRPILGSILEFPFLV
jgi:hypothetical protein